MSDRAGYAPELMESLGKCRQCGGTEDYPMLVEAPRRGQVCRARFHTLRFRVASAVFEWLTGERPAQPREE